METSFRRRVDAARHRKMVRIYKSVQVMMNGQPTNTTITLFYGRTSQKKPPMVNSHCRRCGVCAYQVRCSCRDGCKAGVSCRHAHALMTFVEEARELLRTIPSPTTPIFPYLSSVSRDGSSASLDDENDPPECSANSSSMDGDNADLAKEEFRRLEGVVAVIMESGRAFMRVHRFEDIARMNAELRTFCSALEIPRPLSRRSKYNEMGRLPEQDHWRTTKGKESDGHRHNGYGKKRKEKMMLS